MCHALTTKGKPCRNRGYTNSVKVTTIEEHPETFHTGFCLPHVKALNHGPIPIWTWSPDRNDLIRKFVRLEVS